MRQFFQTARVSGVLGVWEGAWAPGYAETAADGEEFALALGGLLCGKAAFGSFIPRSQDNPTVGPFSLEPALFRKP